MKRDSYILVNVAYLTMLNDLNLSAQNAIGSFTQCCHQSALINLVRKRDTVTKTLIASFHKLYV